VKIALGQINPTIGDFTGNSQKIVEFARKAHAAGAHMTVFSELAICGYPPRDLLEKPAFVARSQQMVREIAAALPPRWRPASPS
jgi:NAD+ synthase (glutamine-hydrolysing)